MQDLKVLTEDTARAEIRLSILLNCIADTIERLAPWIACFLLIGILFDGVLRALYVPFNFDELYTTFVSRFPRTSDFWSFARTGADGQPPFYYYLTKAGIGLVRNEPLGVRLPSIAGYALFSFSLCVFVSRIGTKIYGLAAILATAMTGCWFYMTAARPYSMVLGCTGLAAICWQSIVLRQRRWVALAGMAVSLAGVFALHFLSLLVILPFGIAELVRTIQRKRVDVAVWAALAASLLVLVPTLPVALAASSNGGIRSYYIAQPRWYGSLTSFGFEFLGPLIVALVVVAVTHMAAQSSGRLHDASGEYQVRLKVMKSGPEIALILALTCLPLFAVAVGRFVTHSFYNRYGIAGMFGIVAVIIVVIWSAAPGKLASVGVMLLFGSIFAYTMRLDIRYARYERANPDWKILQERIALVASQDKLPIAFADPFPFMELTYYGDAALVSRMFYLASPEYELAYTNANNGEIGMLKSAPYFGTKVADFKIWTKQHRVFYLVASDDRFALSRFIEGGARMELVQRGLINSSGGPSDLFFRVTMPAE